MAEQPIDITKYVTDRAAEVRPAIRVQVRLREPLMPATVDAGEGPEEPAHTSGTLRVFNLGSTSSSGATVYASISTAWLAIPQTEVGTYVSEGIIQNLNIQARAERWVPPNARPRRRPL
jgi:hypothetical protein